MIIGSLPALLPPLCEKIIEKESNLIDRKGGTAHVHDFCKKRMAYRTGVGIVSTGVWTVEQTCQRMDRRTDVIAVCKNLLCDNRQNLGCLYFQNKKNYFYFFVTFKIRLR